VAPAVPPPADAPPLQQGTADPEVEVAPLPPLEDRGTTADAPLPPGQENSVLPLQQQPGNPLFRAPVAGAPIPSEATPLTHGRQNSGLPAQQTGNPLFGGSGAGAPAPGPPLGAAADASIDGAVPVPQTTTRPPRAVRRQLPAGEQVLRALQSNGTN
jgi:hypothetical protein